MTENAAKLKFADAVLSISPTEHPTNVLFQLDAALTEYEKDHDELAERQTKKAEENGHPLWAVQFRSRLVKDLPWRFDLYSEDDWIEDGDVNPVTIFETKEDAEEYAADQNLVGTEKGIEYRAVEVSISVLG